jgi:hypothetical protein
MDHREEQENELMALESIYYDEYTCCVAPFFLFFLCAFEHDGRIVIGLRTAYEVPPAIKKSPLYPMLFIDFEFLSIL